ncbi:helix-turn-helix transcriptional regulator [Alicyclobacillus macrosporangiidus]|uniref:helix-turn-helix transcriptional regulator n=1 Tax=Alicyclobacillus macrosporangiidus TaxID=392015 RepID=UPI000497AFA4|nr:helix-turn-helix transcriptional regulator [Alicyclobacillus macrosporangiidus]
MQNRVREERIKRNMSYSELADLLGLSERAVRYIESGQRKPSLKTAVKIEKVLGIRPRELLVQDDSTVEVEVKQA